MLLVRSLRPDRVSFCVTTFIINNLGSQYVEPPVLDMQQVVDDSSTKTPLIFVLSAGVVSRLLSWWCCTPFISLYLILKYKFHFNSIFGCSRNNDIGGWGGGGGGGGGDPN